MKESDEPMQAEPVVYCEHRCLKDEDHIERGEPHFYGYLHIPESEKRQKEPEMGVSVDAKTVFYMSFCDTNLPKNQQWLGGSYVVADDVATAMTVSWLTGCNPGGEIELRGPIPIGCVKADFRNVLLDRDGIEDAFDETYTP